MSSVAGIVYGRGVNAPAHGRAFQPTSSPLPPRSGASAVLFRDPGDGTA